MTINNLLDVVIPCYIRTKEDLENLNRCLKSLEQQILKPSKIYLSDDSPTNLIDSRFLGTFPGLAIKYTRNPGLPGVAQNSNFGVSQTRSEWVHVLHQDDWLSNPKVYESLKLWEVDSPTQWILMTGKNQTGKEITPNITESMLLGFNEVGGPSCMIVRKSTFIELRPDFSLLVDVCHFSDYLRSYGAPKIVSEVKVIYGESSNQLSKRLSSKMIDSEIQKVINVYGIQQSQLLRIIDDQNLNTFMRMYVLRAAGRNKRIHFLKSFSLWVKLSAQRLRNKVSFND